MLPFRIGLPGGAAQKGPATHAAGPNASNDVVTDRSQNKFRSINSELRLRGMNQEELRHPLCRFRLERLQTNPQTTDAIGRRPERRGRGG